MFTSDQINIITFCAAECARQGSGEQSVAWMVSAYNKVISIVCSCSGITAGDILELGTLVEPEVNANGFRRTSVTFANCSVIGWENIERQIANLLDAQTMLTPTEFYREFEWIHPFGDGNGRVGAILYNMLNGTLMNPVIPPQVEF